MKVITERDLIRTVRQRCGKWNRSTLEEFGKLDLETCSAEDVNKVIGNDSWTREKCDECGTWDGWLIEVGEEPDYESRTACLCRGCFDKALALVQRGV